VRGFSSSSSVFSCQYHHSIIVIHAHISPGGRTVGPLVAAVQRDIVSFHRHE
jgi:hypothetical protein